MRDASRVPVHRVCRGAFALPAPPPLAAPAVRGPRRKRQLASEETAATTRRTATSEAESISSATKQRASVLQRHEKTTLGDEVRVLEAEVDRLRRRVGLPTAEDRHLIDVIRAQSFDIDHLLHTNGLYLSSLDSMITNELLTPPVNTLSMFIHLPSDMEQRRTILRGMQELKLRRGIEAASEWLHHLDHTTPYLDEKSFTTASGEYHYDRFQIDQFPNFPSAREAFNTYVQFLYNMEMSVTEGLGQFTLREDSDDLFDPTIWNHRFVTVAEDVGVPEELNFVGFAQFYPYSSVTNSPMGIIVTDTVNIDDLYPYVPEERTCKDIQAVHMIFEVPKLGTGETVVVFKHCCLAVQLPPQFDVTDGALAQLQKNFPKWPNFIAKYLHEYVVPDASVQ